MDLFFLFPNGRMTGKHPILWVVTAMAFIAISLAIALHVSAKELTTREPNPAAGISISLATDRPRPRMSGNTIITGDTGVHLRGENPRRDDSAARNDPAWWANLRDNYHMNVVRILIYRPPQNYPGGCGNNCNLPTAQQIIPDLDEWVNRASENGFYAIIDYHPVGGRDETDAIEWWSVIAPRYKDRTHVIYEVTNEPGGAGVGLAGYEERMRQRIRADAPNTPLILWSVENARDNNVNAILQYTPQTINANWNNAIIGLHMYWDYNYSTVQQLKNTYPLMNTEIGGWNENDYMKVTDDAESLGISWIWLDGATDDRVPPSSVYWPRDPYFDGVSPIPTATATAPSGTPSPTPTATASPPPGTPSPTPTPGGSERIQLPNRIEAENYMDGGEGTGYHDTTDGNLGKAYRDDDVDIQTTNDVSGLFNIAWIDAGEWLAYNVYIPQSGYYDVTVRVASGESGTKKLHFEVDGDNVSGSINYTDFSGWQTWRNASAYGIYLPEGAHQLKIVFDTGNLNLNSIDITASLNTGSEFKVFLPLVKK